MEDSSKRKKIIITGGHLTPALALLDFLQSKGFTNIEWIGVKHSQTFSNLLSAEYKEITNRKLKFYNLHAGKTWLKWTRHTFIKALYNTILIPVGFVQAFFIIMVNRPALIISFGGYLALPVVLAGWLFEAKCITHEQTITAGLSNKIISKLSDKVLVSWKTSLKYYPKDKVILTGNPIRSEVLNVTTNKYNLDKSLPTIYFTGGNQGSNTINWRLFEILPQLLKQVNVIHQTGNSTITNDYEKAKQLYLGLSDELKKRYIFFDSVFGPEIGEIYDKADLIVTRAGANTVSEIVALNKYALFIPIPWSSHNEQQLNAEYAVAEGCGVILKQKDDMKPKEFYNAVVKALDSALNIKQSHRKSSTPSRQDAIEKIYIVIEQLI